MKPTVYLSVAQLTAQQSTQNTFELRTTLPLSTMRSTVEAAVAGVSREVPLEFYTLAEQVDDTLVQERVLAMLSGFFGAVALLLAMVGLYGTMSYRVALRRAEFGIRMALGAQVSAIVRLVLSEVVLVVMVGVAAGAAISFLATRALQKLLYGLGAHDAVRLSSASLLLAAVALAAAYVPARRAARVDPMVALRYE
jgi:putative ABC transport system permease protein